MIKRFIILLLIGFLTLQHYNCHSQELRHIDSLYRNAAEDVVDKYLSTQIVGKNRLVYSMGTKSYLIIIENPTCYEHFIILLDFNNINGIANSYMINKPDSLLAKAFEIPNYLEGFTNIHSEFYKNGYESALTYNSSYFVIIDNNENKHGEAVMPIVINPCPIPNEVYNYLYKTLISGLNHDKHRGKKRTH